MKAKLIKVLMTVSFAFTLLSCSSNTITDSIVPQAKLVQNYDYQPDEIELINLINAYRVSIGLNELQVINHISYKSEEHNEYMIANKVVNHDLFEERAQNIIQVLGAVKVNENVAYNFSTSTSVLHAWLASPGHKANIEGDFTHFGLSVRENPVNGNKYYTNIFIRK
jgi:uncharacterized protein YkwD